MCIETVSQTSNNFFKKINLSLFTRETYSTLRWKSTMDISPKIMNEIFQFSKNSLYSLGSGIQLEKSSINNVQFGSESTVYLGAKIWELIPENIKSFKSVDIFKSKIKKMGT